MTLAIHRKRKARPWWLVITAAAVLVLAAVSGGALRPGDRTAAAGPTIVYNAIPNPLPPNVASVGFQATQTAEFGDYVHLAGTDRVLMAVTVTMSDWALYSDYTSDVRYSGNPSNWSHPIKVNVYSNHLGLNGVPDTLLATRTQTVSIPWRPAADPTCSPATAWRAGDGNCYSGLAFNTTFDMSSLGAVLPNDVIVGIAFNTQTWGAQPIGSSGPYNSLNVGAPTGQTASVGTDDSADRVFWNTSTASNYADGGSGGVGTFRQDSNWTPNGTVSFSITASAPLAGPAPVIVPTSGSAAGGGSGGAFVLGDPSVANQSPNLTMPAIYDAKCKQATINDSPSQDPGVISGSGYPALSANLDGTFVPCTLDALNYDDDPAGMPGGPTFYVTPIADDSPLRWVHKKIFIDVASGDNISAVEASISKTVCATAGAPPACTGIPATKNVIVWDKLIPGANGMKGPNCGAYLGNVGSAGTIADAIVKTGQISSADFQLIRNRCMQSEVKAFNILFPVSKHLPPGTYHQCVVISYNPSGSSAPVCRDFVINELTAWKTDFNGGLNFGSSLRQNQSTVLSGDFIFDSTANPAKPTVEGIGNTSPTFTVEWTWLKNATPNGNKYIKSWFDVQLNRRNKAGDIVQTEHYDTLNGGGDPDTGADGGFAGSSKVQFRNICLEPNQDLKVDFSVTPVDSLFTGSYAGKVRLILVSDVDPNTPGNQYCGQATLSPTEWAGGDNSVGHNTDDNLPDVWSPATGGSALDPLSPFYPAP